MIVNHYRLHPARRQQAIGRPPDPGGSQAIGKSYRNLFNDRNIFLYLRMVNPYDKKRREIASYIRSLTSLGESPCKSKSPLTPANSL
jgi:hypothetical protein